MSEIKRLSHNILAWNARYIISLLSWKLCDIWLGLHLVLCVAWILSSCSSVEMIEDDYSTYYDLLFLIELGDNASLSKALN